MKPKRGRLWIGILAVAGGIACIIAVFFATVGAATGGVSQAGESRPSAQPAVASSQVFDGVVTDTRCGAKHTPAIPETAADCTRACVHSGEHFALVDGDKVYVLQGEPEMLKRAAGERVTIAGTLSGSTIAVRSVRLSTP